MHWIIVGAGAVGATLGVRLHVAGQDVLMVGRPGMVAAMSGGSFALVSPSGRTATRFPAVSALSPGDIRDDSVVLLCVKSQQVPAAIAELAACVPPSVPVVCFQNGVRAEPMAAERFTHVYAALNVISAVYVRDGEVLTGYDPPGAAWLEIGRYPEGLDETCAGIVDDLQKSGFVALRNERVQSLKYAKLLINLSNAVRAIADALVPAVWIAAQREGEDVLRRAGIPFDSTIAIEDRTTFLRRCSGTTLVNLGSTWQSLTRGVATEVDYLNGEIVRLAAEHGVSAPVNATLVDLVHEMEARQAPPGYLTPAALVRACRLDEVLLA